MDCDSEQESKKGLLSTQAKQKLQYQFSAQPLERNEETPFTFFSHAVIVQVPGSHSQIKVKLESSGQMTLKRVINLLW